MWGLREALDKPPFLGFVVCCSPEAKLLNRIRQTLLDKHFSWLHSAGNVDKPQKTGKLKQVERKSDLSGRLKGTTDAYVEV